MASPSARPRRIARVVIGAALTVVGLAGACASTEPLQIDPADEPVKALITACDEGVMIACVDLAERSRSGHDAKRDEARALALYEKACAGGHAGACEQLAALHGASGASPAATVRYLERACAEGEGDACVRAGLDAIARTPPEPEKAAPLLAEGCERDVAQGCTASGVLFSEGRGVARSDEQARELFEKGCRLGDAQGCANLAVFLEAGRGALPDDERAGALYEEACAKDVAQACFNLAVRHRRGGALEGAARASTLFEKACGLGLAPGCRLAATQHARGVGGRRDGVRARSFAERGCALHDEKSCALKDAIDRDPALAP